MTVNERLLVAGLLNDFDRAVRAGDVHILRKIIPDVKLSDESVDVILRQVLIGPSLVRCLKENRHVVFALARSPQPSHAVAELGAEPPVIDSAVIDKGGEP
jgi:hypothetical protein